MKRIIFIIFFIIFPFFANRALPANPHKSYKSYLSADGMVYFIAPQKMPSIHKATSRKMIYDITCVSGLDSISYTATLFTKEPQTLNSVTILTENGKQIITPVEPIFTEITGSYYKYRIRFYISWDEWLQLYLSKNPYTIKFNDKYMYAYSESQWYSKRASMNQIIHIIKLNRQ